jgi:hypothetical protein
MGIEDLQTSIQADLSANFPLITVKEVTITPSQDTNTVSINVNYFFSGTEEELNMLIA